MLTASFVVPHSSNRGGEPCKSMRCKELVGMICVDGCDKVEATMNSVAVQQMPEEERKRIARQNRMGLSIGFTKMAGFNPDSYFLFLSNRND